MVLAARRSRDEGLTALPLLMSAEDVASLLGCSRRSVDVLAETGQLTAITSGPGKGRQFHRQTVVDFADHLLEDTRRSTAEARR